MIARIRDDIESSHLRYGKGPQWIELGIEEWRELLDDLHLYQRDGMPLPFHSFAETLIIYDVPIERTGKHQHYRVVIEEKVFGDSDLLYLRRRHGDGEEVVQVLLHKREAE